MPPRRERESGPRQARFLKSFITTTAAGNLTEDQAMRNALVAVELDEAVLDEQFADRLVSDWLAS